MLQETPAIPHNLAQLLWLVLASSLGWLGGWLSRRKREPVEIAKLTAETRQIHVSTDLSLIEAATTAIGKAERLQAERDHWELKCFDLQSELKQANTENSQLTVQAHLDAHQIKRLKAVLDFHNISYAELDHPH